MQMTTSEKKRILRMPTVRGEIVIESKLFGRPLKQVYKISHHGSKNVPGEFVLLSLTGRNMSSLQDVDVYMRADDRDIEFCIPGLGNGWLTQRMPYSAISVLWVTYQGEERSAA